MLTLRILLRSEELTNQEVEHLILGKVDSTPSPMPEVLKSFLNDSIWAASKALENIKIFNSFTNSLDSDYL